MYQLIGVIQTRARRPDEEDLGKGIRHITIEEGVLFTYDDDEIIKKIKLLQVGPTKIPKEEEEEATRRDDNKTATGVEVEEAKTMKEKNIEEANK